MESLIELVNRIQRACTVLGDYGGDGADLPTLWESLPSVAVVGGQVRVSYFQTLDFFHSYDFFLMFTDLFPSVLLVCVSSGNRVRGRAPSWRV